MASSSQAIVLGRVTNHPALPRTVLGLAPQVPCPRKPLSPRQTWTHGKSSFIFPSHPRFSEAMHHFLNGLRRWGVGRNEPRAPGVDDTTRQRKASTSLLPTLASVNAASRHQFRHENSVCWLCGLMHLPCGLTWSFIVSPKVPKATYHIGDIVPPKQCFQSCFGFICLL